MALPKLNDVPKYELTIPSTGKTITFRPFLVKEQKILLMAMETKDQKQMLQAVSDTIDACLYDKINVRTLATFDIEYIFTQIRAKSVGESTEVSLICSECEHPTPVNINLEEIKVDTSEIIDSLVVLNDQYTVQLKPPQYKKILDGTIKDANSITDTVYGTVLMSLDKLITEEEQIDFNDETEEEIKGFIESLNNEQFTKIMDYVNSLPTVSHDVDFKCENCDKENKVTMRGLQDFF